MKEVLLIVILLAFLTSWGADSNPQDEFCKTTSCNHNGDCKDGKCNCNDSHFGVECESEFCEGGCGQGSCNKDTKTCICPPEMSGPHCEIDEFCKTTSCNHNGDCKDGKCNCNDSHFGVECESEFCEGGCGQGSCNKDTKICICPPEMSGPHCEIDEFCKTTSCNHNGDCKDGKCNCNDSHFGVECESEFCEGGCGQGSCNKDTKTCICPPEMSGPHCEIDEFCKTTSCNHNGDCKDGKCNCNDSHFGVECESEFCEGGCGQGSCNKDTKICICPPEMSGPHCEIDEFCKTTSCNHNGDCKDGKCNCNDSHFGVECESEFCEGGCGQGSCNKDTKICICPPEMSGPHCEIESEFCEGGCRQGSCNKDTKICNCPPEMRGPHCEIDEFCKTTSCNHNGDCKDGKCNCNDSHFGVECESELCEGGCGQGVCNKATKICICPPEMRGQNCEIDIKKNCADNGGTIEGYICTYDYEDLYDGLDIDDDNKDDGNGKTEGNGDTDGNGGGTGNEADRPLTVGKGGVVYEGVKEDESSSTHFLPYFLVAAVICIVGYVVYHNRKKILGIALEGTSGRKGSGRRPNSRDYSKLEENVSDSMLKGGGKTYAY